MLETGVDAPFRVLLVDDHAIVREGLKRLLEPIAESWSLTDACNGFEALDAMRRETFQLVILDLTMPGMNGLELIRRIKAEFPPTLMLVLTMHAEEQYAMRAFKAGANGYVTKDSASSELITAVRKVLAGGAYVTSHLAERVIQMLNGVTAAPAHAELSNRELEVLRRFVAGQRPIEIANALNMSIKTVSTHKVRIQEKLKLPSLAALIRYGLEHKLDEGEIAPDLGGT